MSKKLTVSYELTAEVLVQNSDGTFDPIDKDTIHQKYFSKYALASRNESYKDKNRFYDQVLKGGYNFFNHNPKGPNHFISIQLDFKIDKSNCLIIEGSDREETLISKQEEYNILKNKNALPAKFKPKIVTFGLKDYKIIPDNVPLPMSWICGVETQI